FSLGAVISMVIALAGSFIISWGDFQIGGMALFGDILAFLGAIAITGYFLLGQRLRRSLSLMTYTVIVYAISLIILILSIDNFNLNDCLLANTINFLFIFLELAIFPTFFGHTIFNWALKLVSTSNISMAIVFEPIGASILAYFILGEVITYTQWLGGFIVIFGLFLFIMSTAKKRKITIAKKE